MGYEGSSATCFSCPIRRDGVQRRDVAATPFRSEGLDISLRLDGDLAIVTDFF